MDSRPEYKHAEVTEQIIRAFYKVYNTLGYGFLERVYVEALLPELKKLGLTVANEVAIDVLYAGEVTGEYLADLVLNGVVIVEVKAAKILADEHEAQLLNYLKANNFEVGLLLNFGPNAEIKRKAFDNAHKGRLTWAASRRLLAAIYAICAICVQANSGVQHVLQSESSTCSFRP